MTKNDRSLFRLPAPSFMSVHFVWAIALFFTLPGNLPLWKELWGIVGINDVRSFLFALSLPLFLFATLNLVFSLLAWWPYLRKPLVGLLLLISAACAYFILNYRILIDRGMVKNFFYTDKVEVFSYFSFSLLLWVLVFGVVPAWFVFRIRLKPDGSLWKNLSTWLGNISLSILILLLIAFGFYKDYASLFRNNKPLAFSVLPINFIGSTYSYLKHSYNAVEQPLQPIATDATHIPSQGRPKLLVLVVGETARARNFSLHGYERPTNPMLSARPDVLYFQNATSCGTATVISLPCMFSPMPRKHFDEELASRQENLVDVLQRTGISVLWRENNNGGCKGVCNRIPNETLSPAGHPELCPNADGTCYDNILLTQLSDKIRAMPSDGVIVLHQIGSHGPTYFQRYPASARRFTPTCDTNQIQTCTTEALVNTYDNSILYTDQMLSDTIELLKTQDLGHDIALIYASDHGESLGEKGLYLHAAPYMIAPDEQTHIPMIAWLSDGFARQTGMDMNCLRQRAKTDEFSHDNWFHSVLGLMDVQTSAYQADLDIFAPCRSRQAG